MALPTTITGIATDVACVGPFISSGGNVYFFGKDSSTATTLQAFKATDPTTSFSSIATKTGFSTAVQALSGFQVADVIHLCVIDGATTSVNAKYQTFDMSSDTFVTAETIASAFNPQTSGSANVYGISNVVRSGGEVVAFFNGARVANMGNSYAQTYYSRRTGVNTWTAATQVSAGGTVDFTQPEAVLGASDRIQFVYKGTSTSGYNRTALTSGNVLQTTQPASVTANGFSGISYDNAGTQKDIIGRASTSATNVDAFDDGNTPAINTVVVEAVVGTPVRTFNDIVTAYCVYRDSADSDLYVETSTDNGATWGTKTNIFTGTVAGVDTNLSIDGNIFLRGSDYVIPYVVNDNGTLKYNEYVVRSIASDELFAQSVM